MWVNSFELITFVPQKGKSLFCFNKNTKQGFKFLNIMNQIYAKLDIETTDWVIDNLSTIIYSLFTLNDSNLFNVSTLMKI